MSLYPIGSVWDDTTLVIMVLDEPDEDDRLTTLVLDNGPWPKRPGSFYRMHKNSFARYYTRIA